MSLWKTAGLTPLQTIQKLRQLKPEYAQTVLGYAGRLDPLAEGVMLVLVGEENKARQKYFDLDKEYEFEVLFGYQTESHDVMSLPVLAAASQTKLSRVPLDNLVGKKLQEYPKHSTPRIAKNYAEVPPKEVEVFSLELVREFTQPADQVLAEIEVKLDGVTGNFNQLEFLKAWKSLLEPLGPRPLNFARFRAHVSSGTYIRLLAHQMGGLAWRITRTRVGDFTAKDAILV